MQGSVAILGKFFDLIGDKIRGYFIVFTGLIIINKLSFGIGNNMDIVFIKANTNTSDTIMQQ